MDVTVCADCAKVLPSQPSNPMTTSSPSTHFGFPMQHIGLGLFSFRNKEFLICVDHWSGYRFYSHLRSLSSTSVIATLTTWFNLFGWPSSIRSDGGPQFCGEFTRFCESHHHICHELSAHYNPKSNGLAEAGVKSVKNILRKSFSSGANADHMLYEWRNVPRSDGCSPAQLMFGCAQRTSLPTLPSQNVPINFNLAASSKDAAHARAKLDHDRSKLSLTSLSHGQEVYLQYSKSSAWDKREIIVSMRPDSLLYVIRVDNRFFTRPRRLLRPVACLILRVQPCQLRCFPPIRRLPRYPFPSRRLRRRRRARHLPHCPLPHTIFHLVL